eukprot:TRINITY_DN2266_c0_g1_i5.p1 TRINITY_DN2266_c0_g1~~TRINITY_DN2266_c0_g1_i5.p1  ORF type:complete len:121 (-),score=20.20 TRINITY_DN2266_c0_g1_i5:856-1218(-)
MDSHITLLSCLKEAKNPDLIENILAVVRYSISIPEGFQNAYEYKDEFLELILTALKTHKHPNMIEECALVFGCMNQFDGLLNEEISSCMVDSFYLKHVRMIHYVGAVLVAFGHERRLLNF